MAGGGTGPGASVGGVAPGGEDPAEAETTALFQPVTSLGNLNFFSCFLVLPFVAVFFLKRYHAGEIGVARGLQIFAAVLALTLVVQFFVACRHYAGAGGGLVVGIRDSRTMATGLRSRTAPATMRQRFGSWAALLRTRISGW